MPKCVHCKVDLEPYEEEACDDCKIEIACEIAQTSDQEHLLPVLPFDHEDDE